MSRPVVVRLAGLFAMDSFGGGFVVQSFIAFWLAERFGASIGVLGVTFFAIGLLQTGSFLAAAPLAERFGLLATMVFTHLPSNVLLMAVAFAPSLPVAIGLLLARVVLSQMDVPTRQAYVMALVDPGERTAAAGVTNTARYLVRPLGPVLAGAAQTFGLGAPFVIAGTVKGAYDLILWRWFRTVSSPTTRRSRCDRLPAHRCRPARGSGPLPGMDRRREGGAGGARHPRRARPRTAGAEGETVVVTIWPSHEAFDAWIATPNGMPSPPPTSTGPSTTGRSPATRSPAATSTCSASPPSPTPTPPRRPTHEVGHPCPPQDRPHRLPVADPPVHRP